MLMPPFTQADNETSEYSDLTMYDECMFDTERNANDSSDEAEKIAQICNQFDRDGLQSQRLEDSTMIKLDKIERMWNRYCQTAKSGTLFEVFIRATLGTFAAFFTWYLQKHKVQKTQTVRTMIFQLNSLCYALTNTYIDKDIKVKLQNLFRARGELTLKFGLSAIPNDTPTVEYDDFMDLMFTLWFSVECRFSIEHVRISLHGFKLFAASTASRAGALVGTMNRKGIIWHYMTYRDCKLLLLPDPADPCRAMRCLEVTLRWTKTSDKHKKPSTYVFHETPQLGLCPVTFFIFQAFFDSAFLPLELRSPKDLYNLKVPSGLRKRYIPWKQSALDLPIFRTVEQTGKGSYCFGRKPLDQRVLLSYLRRVCLAANWQHKVSSYGFRRGTGNALAAVVPTAILTQIMGHKNATIFTNHYQSSFVQCDVHSVFFGLPSQDKLRRYATRLCSAADPRIPKRLVEKDWLEIYHKEPVMRSLESIRQFLREECLKTYGSIFNASMMARKALVMLQGDQRAVAFKFLRSVKDAELLRLKGPYSEVLLPHTLYVETRRRLRNLRIKLRHAYLEKKRQEFPQSVAVDDIGRHIRDLPSTVPEPVVPVETPRLHIAKLLFAENSPEPGSDEDIERRIQMIELLLEHAPRQEFYARKQHVKKFLAMISPNERQMTSVTD